VGQWRGAGLEPITLHEARHTFASLLIAAGVNAKAIATYMGHASVTITYDRLKLRPDDEARRRDQRCVLLLHDHGSSKVPRPPLVVVPAGGVPVPAVVLADVGRIGA
jgi:hypothetical protein